MKIKTWIKYEESYIPPRCRKPRYKECEDRVDINLPETTMSALQLAFEDSSYQGAGKIFFYKGKLWAQAKVKCTQWCEEKNIHTPLDELIYDRENCSTYFRFAYPEWPALAMDVSPWTLHGRTDYGCCQTRLC